MKPTAKPNHILADRPSGLGEKVGVGTDIITTVRPLVSLGSSSTLRALLGAGVVKVTGYSCARRHCVLHKGE